MFYGIRCKSIGKYKRAMNGVAFLAQLSIWLQISAEGMISGSESLLSGSAGSFLETLFPSLSAPPSCTLSIK